MEPPLPGLVGLLFLLLLGAFFSAAQAALTNARRHLLRDLIERGNHRAQRALEAAEDSTRVLATFQLASLLAHFLIAGLLIVLFLDPLSSLMASLMPSLPQLGVVLSYLIGISIAAFIVFALIELLPATLAQRHAEAWAMTLAGPARITMALFAPLVAVVARLRRSIAAPHEGESDGSLVTEEEIMTLVDAGEEEGAIELEEKEMIYSIFQLDETMAREIMLPRIDIVALDINTPLDQAIEVIIRAGHSRIPLYEESLDHVKGMLYAKDLLTVWRKDRRSVSLKSLLRPALFIPETKRVLDLLRELQKAKVHMAIIIDEYGGTAGLVTIEDIVEEIVGEIMDEYDQAEEAPFEMVSQDEYIFDAGIGLDDFNHTMDTHLPDELADTLGGFIYGRLGKVPAVGETIETEHLRLEVIWIVDQRIRKVRVKRLPSGGDSPTTQDGNNHATTGNSH